MDDGQELQLPIRGSQEPPVSLKETNPADVLPPSALASKFRRWKHWLMVTLMSFLVLTGQTAGTLLGRFYYEQGGNSKWMATLVQSVGSVLLLIPLLVFASSSSTSTSILSSLTTKVAFIFISFGVLAAGFGLMYSYGLLYLPVSTFSLICATQLAFNAVFSYFFNSQKFTALIFNSVVLLTFSAALLGISTESETSASLSTIKYALGFILTLTASAVFSLYLSLTQLVFEKVLKRMAFRVVLEFLACTGFTASITCTIGMFGSGEWRSLKGEMESFGKGRLAYVMVLVWTAISWQVASVGAIGLIFTVSSLFSNVIGTLGLPLVPIFAVIFFHDRMDGVKVTAMLIAIWGFLSYIYQHYLDDSKSTKMAKDDSLQISVASAP